LFEKQPLYKIIPTLFAADAIQRPVSGDTTWQKVSLVFTATGKELYLTLGNFSKRDITGATGKPLENHFFIFFDDISLKPEDPNEKICDSWQKARDEIYAFDARHNFLDLYVTTYMKKPPDPPDIDATIFQTIDTVILHDVLFATDQSELSRKSFRLLDSLCDNLSRKRIDSIVVEGHTDSTGTIAHNQKLSKDRSKSVADYVAGKLLMRQELIRARGWGSDKPVSDNRTPDGRQLNRRVEIFIYIRH
jgi:outer membrane protein OmpA-like peptidoglycan-associated protein